MLPTTYANTFLLIVCTAAVAAIAAALLAPRVRIPVVVFELLLGIIIGPHVLALGSTNAFVAFFADLGC